MSARRFTNWILDVLFPRRCPCCGEVVGFLPACGCAEERGWLALPPEPLSTEGRVAAHYRRPLAAYWYKGILRRTVIRFKLENRPELAGFLGGEMARLLKNSGLAAQYDLLVPVPVSPKTMRRRGYNQSALLARRVAECTGLPCEEEALQKVKETKPQMSLGREQRLRNVKGAYAVVDAEAVRGKRILLVDDVLTTGSTMDECAKTLLRAGAACCGVLCATAA